MKYKVIFRQAALLTSMLRIYPEHDLAIVTLVNLSSARMDDLAKKIADIILSAPTKK